MNGIALTCCSLCNKWFDYNSVEVAIYDHGKVKNFCSECGNRLLKHIEKMEGKDEKKDESEANNNERT